MEVGIMHKKIGIIIFALIIILLPVVTIITRPREKKAFSENENRYLTEMPDLTLENIKDETFMTKFDSWFSDRFYGRENWISLMNNTERTLGKTEISTVYTKNDQMLQVLSEYDDIGAAYSTDTLEQNVSVINSFAANHPDTPVYFILCPTSVGVYGSDLLTQTIQNVSIDERDIIDNCYSALENVTPVDVYSSLSANKDSYIYYRTDHHWTSLGAYVAYEASGVVLGYTPYALSDFNKETGSSEFQGTLFSKTLDQSVTKDIIDMYTLAEGTTTTLISSNGIDSQTYDSIFFPEYLEVKDKYSTFTGQNAAVVTIKTTHDTDSTIETVTQDNQPVANDSTADTSRSILVIKDSYANSIMQFLCNNYDTITMLDMRYINQSIDNLINVEDYDQVLFLYNCITFSDDGDLIKLNMN
jgi:hypothetical protein